MGVELELWAIVVLAVTFTVGGLVKGLLAFGLPLVMVPPLSLVFPVPTAIALVTLPILLTNAWQMFHAGGVVSALKRLWPLIVPLLITLVLSAHLLIALDETVILITAGVVVLTFVLVDIVGLKLTVPPRHERLFGVVAGIAGGFIGGITSFFGTPPLMYLHALHMGKDRFVQATAIILFAGGVVLMMMLGKLDVLGRTELAVSAVGMIPLVIGLVIGQKLRAKINQDLFRDLVLFSLLAVGVSMIARAAFG